MVAKTISKGVIDPLDYVDFPELYSIAMPAVLAGASVITIISTIYGLPISITKGTVFGLLAVGLTSIGHVMPKGIIKCIVGLFVSPILGMTIAFLLHLLLIVTIKKAANPVRRARII